MNLIASTRGHFVVCDDCLKFLKAEGIVDKNGKAEDDVSSDFCPNCFDRNRILIDDLAGSSE